MSQITLNLPDKLAAELAAASRRSNQSPVDLAVELLRKALVVQRFRAAREDVLATLGDEAVESDDNAFEQLK
jgi:hypothetical protein